MEKNTYLHGLRNQLLKKNIYCQEARITSVKINKDGLLALEYANRLLALHDLPNMAAVYTISLSNFPLPIFRLILKDKL